MTDIHTRNAVKLFGVSEDAVTPAMRHKAKNFGYIQLYGGRGTMCELFRDIGKAEVAWLHLMGVLMLIVLANLFGRPLGVLFGTVYAGWLWLVNRNKPAMDVGVMLPSGAVLVIWTYEARYIWPGNSCITFGRRVYAKYTIDQMATLPWLATHEHAHVAQYETLGWLEFLWRYGYEIVRWGYFNAPLEVAARKAAGER